MRQQPELGRLSPDPLKSSEFRTACQTHAHLANGAPAALKLSIPDAHSHREGGYGRRISDSYAGSVNEGAPKKANPAVSLLVFPSAILRTDQVYRLSAYFLLYKKRFFGDVDSPSHASIVHGFKVDSPCFY